MGQPKKQSSPRKTGLRRSHLRLELARRVNKTSPVKSRTTRKESGKTLAAALFTAGPTAQKITPARLNPEKNKTPVASAK